MKCGDCGTQLSTSILCGVYVYLDANGAHTHAACKAVLKAALDEARREQSATEGEPKRQECDCDGFRGVKCAIHCPCGELRGDCSCTFYGGR